MVFVQIFGDLVGTYEGRYHSVKVVGVVILLGGDDHYFAYLNLFELRGCEDKTIKNSPLLTHLHLARIETATIVELHDLIFTAVIWWISWNAEDGKQCSRVLGKNS